MDEISFTYLEKAAFLEYAPILFSILRKNMESIAPPEKSREEEYQWWRRTFGGAFAHREERQIVLVTTEDKKIVGFFGYCIHGDTFQMEEIQFAPEYQGKYDIFRRLYQFVVQHIPANLKYADAYAHKQNSKSISILNRLGLRITGTNESGTCYHLQGTFEDLLRWLNSSQTSRKNIAGEHL